MFNHSLKENFIMTALVISSFSFCGTVQAEEYKAVQVLPANASKAAVGVMKAPAGVYTENSAGAVKDRSQPNSAQVTTAATSATRLNRSGVLVSGQSGLGAAK